MPRVTDYLIAFLIILCLNFALPRLMPGDPLLAIYGEEVLVTMTAETKAELAERAALTGTPGHQFLTYLGALGRGDLGFSYYHQTPVLPLVGGALPWTLLLVGSALIISTALGFVLGLESGWKGGQSQDKKLLTGLMFLGGLPDFFVGAILLLVFGVWLGVFPLAGAVTPYSSLSGFKLLADMAWHLVLPLASLILVEISATYLLTRATVIGIRRRPFILTAQAKGLPENRVKYRHVGRNSLLPVVTRVGVRLGRVLGGALLVEIVFSYPGIGLLTYNGVMTRDYPLLQGIFFITTISVMIINLAVDVIYKKIDPRVV